MVYLDIAMLKRYKTKWYFSVDSNLLIVQFKVHSILNFVILQGDVIFKDGIPFFKHNLVVSRTRLSGNQFLHISYCVTGITFDSHLLSQPVVTCYFNHLDLNGVVMP